MKIAFFPGCMVDMFYPEIGIAAVNVLERLGCEVDMPDDWVCCAQGLINSGYRKEMIPAAKMMVDAYEKSEYDTIVSLTGSCMNAIVNDYQIVFKDDPIYLGRTRKLSERFYEFTDFIVNVLGKTDVGKTSLLNYLPRIGDVSQELPRHAHPGHHRTALEAARER